MQKSGSRTDLTKQISREQALRAILIGLIFAGISIIVVAYRVAADNGFENLAVGEVASQDIFAPSQLVYESDIETQAERERARSSVQTIYSPPDPKIARQQIERLHQIFDYLDTVRADPYGSLAEKSVWIAAIEELTLSDSVVDQILIMSEQAWSETIQEALQIFDQTMRAEIREAQVLLARRQLPTKVELDTPDEQANVIVAITEDLVKPNTFPDQQRTEAERQAAADAVKPRVVSYEENELIVPAGEIIDSREMEAIESLNLQKPRFSWMQDFVAPAILVLLTTILIGVFVVQYTPQLTKDNRRLPLLVFLLVFFIIIAKFLLSNFSNLTHLYPIAALSMMLVILIDRYLAYVITTILAFLAGYMVVNGDPATTIIYLFLSGWTGILALGKGERVNSLLWAGVYVGIVNAIIVFIFNVTASPVDFNSLGLLLLIALLNGIFSAGLALIGLFVIGSVVGITTSVQLIDLGRPTHPLLRDLLLKAPGTYHHSLMVSNLGEQAAERIGANSLLVRVMAYYHDVGKIQRPYFFIENQPEGINVHEKLEPQISAQIIISHVKDGLKVAAKHHLPQAIQDGIAQHHGTSLVKYFFYQAVEAAKAENRQVNEAHFHYPGPKPSTRENGILMLADVSESTVRALKPASADELDEIVQKVISDKLDSGELDDCDLTIADLYKIRTAFVDILQGVHHPRIKYPDQAAPDSDTDTKAAPDEPTPEPPSNLPPTPRPSSRPASLIRRE